MVLVKPANMSADHRDRAELAHGARIAEQNAVEQAPFDVGQRHAQECLKPGGAERNRGFLFIAALIGHQRDQFARDERKRHEDRGQHDSGQRKDDLDIVIAQPMTEPALHAEHQHIDQAGDHRRHGIRQIDQGSEETFSDGNRVWRSAQDGDAEHRVERHGNERDQQRQSNGGKRVGLRNGGERRADPFDRALRKHGHQRQDQEQSDEAYGHEGQDHTGQWVVFGRFSPMFGFAHWRDAASFAAEVESEDENEGSPQHDDADGRRARIIVLLQLDHDQQRRDFGNRGQIAGNEDHRTVFADRAGECQRVPVINDGTEKAA